MVMSEESLADRVLFITNPFFVNHEGFSDDSPDTFFAQKRYSRLLALENAVYAPSMQKVTHFDEGNVYTHDAFYMTLGINTLTDALDLAFDLSARNSGSYPDPLSCLKEFQSGMHSTLKRYFAGKRKDRPCNSFPKQKGFGEFGRIFALQGIKISSYEPGKVNLQALFDVVRFTVQTTHFYFNSMLYHSLN